MDKKNKSKNIIIIVIIIILLAVLIILKNNSNKVEQLEPVSQTQVELQQALESDKTSEIKNSIDSIKVDDTIDTELDSIDKELENL